MPKASRKTVVPLHALPLGRIKAVEYVHAIDGKTYRHSFKKTSGLFYAGTSKSKVLIVFPVPIVRRNGAPFIGD